MKSSTAAEINWLAHSGRSNWKICLIFYFCVFFAVVPGAVAMVTIMEKIHRFKSSFSEICNPTPPIPYPQQQHYTLNTGASLVMLGGTVF